MKSLSLFLASFLVAGLRPSGFGQARHTSAEAAGAVRGETASDLDAIASSYYPATEPGAAVLVMKDGEAMRAVLDRDARLVRTETRNGVPRTRPTSAADFLTRTLEHDGPPLREKIWNSEVRIADNLATVWVPYAFYVGDRLMHCGENAVQLAKTDLGWPGWKIIAMADTQRTEGCSPK